MLISDWLIFLGVDRETAVSDACKVEHDLSEKSFIALQKHIEEWKRSVYMQKSEAAK
jgi:Mn-dependent DtxR family transcriptional regulator